MIDLFSIRACVKEDHYDTSGLSKNRKNGVFLRGIDCILKQGFFFQDNNSIVCMQSRSSCILYKLGSCYGKSYIHQTINPFFFYSSNLKAS